MTSPNQAKTNLMNVLQRFSAQYVSQYQKVHSHLPIIDMDNDWLSPCEVSYDENEINNRVLLKDQTFWLPINIEAKDALSFDNVESALDLILHKDIKTYLPLCTVIALMRHVTKVSYHCCLLGIKMILRDYKKI